MTRRLSWLQPERSNESQKSFGEARMANVYGGAGASWGYGEFGGTWNRHELANHYTGFNYLAIQPLMKEIGGMTPHAAYRRDGQSIKSEQNKAIAAGDWNAFRQIKSRYLNQFERSKAIAPIQTHEELEPISSSHDLVRLLRNPNGPDTAATFFRKLIMFWKLYGEFYIWLVPPNKERLTGIKQPPVEMWVLPSHWVWPKHDPEYKQLFSHFEVKPYAGYFPVEAAGGVGLGWYPGGGAKTIIPADQIVYYCEPNPSGFLNGYSAITAISNWVDCSDNIDRSRTAQFLNGAFPGVVIEFDKSVNDPDKATIDRLEARIASAYTGVRRTGRTVILSPGVKMKPIDSKVDEMAYTESADQIKDWIFAAHGTGQSIAGLVESTTFNNVWGARANFYSNTIKPMVTLLGEVFTEKVARRFDPELVCYWPDTAPVDPDLRLKEMDTMLKNNVLVPNEVGQIMGYPQHEWGDKPLGLLNIEWQNKAMQQQQAQQGTQPGTQPGAHVDALANGKPDSPTLAASPLHGDDNKPENHVDHKIGSARDKMKNFQASPSKNGRSRNLYENLRLSRVH